MPDSQVLLCGVPAESNMCEAIRKLCHHPGRVHNLADDLPLRRLLALLSMAHSCISVDTGPAHAAAALNCPLSDHGAVQVIQGFAYGAGEGSPDIGYITVSEAFDGWCDASGLDRGR